MNTQHIIQKITHLINDNMLNHASAFHLLRELIECTEHPTESIPYFQLIDKINLKLDEGFEFFENILISDDDPHLKSLAAKILIKLYPIKSIPPLTWVINNSTSVILLKNLYYFLETATIQEFKQLNQILIQKIETTYKLALDEALRLFKYILEPLYDENHPNVNLFSIHHSLFTRKDKHVIGLRLPSTLLCEEIRSFPHLESLDLSLNKLKTVPEWIGTLKSLKSLDLHDNNLEMLPDSLSNLKALDNISLAWNNSLKMVPSCIIDIAKTSLAFHYIEEGVHPDEAYILGILEAFFDLKFVKLPNLYAYNNDVKYVYYETIWNLWYQINEEGHIIEIRTAPIEEGETPRISFIPEQIYELKYLERADIYNLSEEKHPKRRFKQKIDTKLEEEINTFYKLIDNDTFMYDIYPLLYKYCFNQISLKELTNQIEPLVGKQFLHLFI